MTREIITDPNAPSGRIGAGAGVGAAALLAMLGLFITPQEGLVLRSYADPVWGPAVPTACLGETGAHIRMGMTFTRDECFGMLAARHQKLLKRVGPCVKRDVPVHAAIALLSMADNLGAGAVCNSTMVRQINEGFPPTVYCEQPLRWMFAAGRDCRIVANGCPGIPKRRAEERAMCLGQLTLPVIT